jgi:hypothetical protein
LIDAKGCAASKPKDLPLGWGLGGEAEGEKAGHGTAGVQKYKSETLGIAIHLVYEHRKWCECMFRRSPFVFYHRGGLWLLAYLVFLSMDELRVPSEGGLMALLL